MTENPCRLVPSVRRTYIQEQAGELASHLIVAIDRVCYGTCMMADEKHQQKTVYMVGEKREYWEMNCTSYVSLKSAVGSHYVLWDMARQRLSTPV